MNVDVKKIIQELIVPELREIKLEIRGVTVEIKRLDEKIDSLRNEMHSELRRLDEKIDSGFARLDDKIDMAMKFRDRIAALEAQVAILTHA